MKRHISEILTAAWMVMAMAIAGCGGGSDACAPGSRNCTCLTGSNACGDSTLSCIQGVCRACQNGACVPAAPKCYSPCRGSFIDKGGTFRVCSDEGLMDGCLAGSHCDDGTCKADPGTAVSSDPSAKSPMDEPLPGADGGAAAPVAQRDPGTCASDPECPQHQVCIYGKCYSDCDTDQDCNGGALCVKKVCRQTCTNNVCSGLGYTCQKLGNTNQVCLPQVATDPQLAVIEQKSVPGSFSLQKDAACAKDYTCAAAPLAFNTNVVEGTFVIGNQSNVDRAFHVAKTTQVQVGPDGAEQVFRAEKGENPLTWLEMGAAPGAERTQAFDVTVPANGQTKIAIKSARNKDLPRWQGTLEVSTNGLGSQTLRVSYSERVPGHWSGQIYYFGNFGDHTQGQDQLNDWMADKTNAAKAQKIPNAFMRAWANFRGGKITSSEMAAVTQGVLTGSWDFDRVKQLCANVNGGVCAPYSGGGNRSVVSITNDPKTAPVPSGVVELGVTLHLGEGAIDSAGCGTDPLCFAGRIESQEALQYPNDPSVVLKFASDPTQCVGQGDMGCLTPISQFSSSMVLGARFRDDTGAGCDKGVDFGTKEFPWLVPGFLRDSSLKPQTSYFECRDSALPFAGGKSTTPAGGANIELAAANPVPDGLQRARTLELVDGLILEQKSMLIIFREKLESFLGGQSDVFTSYGYMTLQRQTAEPTADDAKGNKPAAPSAPRTAQQLQAVCPTYLLTDAFPTAGYATLASVPADKRSELATVIVQGRTGDPQLATPIKATVELPHYLCTWTELQASIAGQTGSGAATTSKATVGRAKIDARCPPYARVVYFTLKASEPFPTKCTSDASEGPPSCEAECNSATSSDEQCDVVLQNWADAGVVRLPVSERSSFATAGDSIFNAKSFPSDSPIFNLTWACQDPTTPICDDYDDLLSKKTFFAAVQGRTVFNSLRTDIKEAYRYKFQFQNRDGQSVGFAPAVCDASSRLVPYCYDPKAILDVRDRVDCALAIYDDHVSGKKPLDGAVAENLRDYLRENFGVGLQKPNPLGDPRVDDGFERLYAELMVMLGDDSYTASFASRFDLAGSQILEFDGKAFETGGIDLSGVAGHEMYKLYQAGQYYQLVLDRFFGQSPWLWNNLQNTDQQVNGFLTNKTVTGYLTRVIRASTQLSNTTSEIARRYQAFNRPDLARRVIERGYARSYLESQILSQFMRRVEQVVPGDQQDEVVTAVRDAERQYRVAMLDMRNAYKRITDDQTVFGFAPDYIPFPALGESDDGAFPVILARAKERLGVADLDEEHALASNRSFQTDAAAFQGELVTIRSDFEKQLSDICGSFTGVDGKVYPAVARYKHLNTKFDSIADPCGLEGGSIFDKHQELANHDVDLRKVNLEASNLTTQAGDLIAKVVLQCKITKDTADATASIQRDIDDCQSDIDQMTTASTAVGRTLDALGQTLQLDTTIGASPFGAAENAADTIAYALASAGAFITRTVLDTEINEKEAEIRSKERDQAQTAAYAQCEQYAAEGAYELHQIQRDVMVKNIDLLTALRDLGTSASELQQLLNERQRLEAQWEDSNQLTINVEAARNDPNVRIYKNDAIINADRSFTAAVQDAYRATKVFEYYTSQSYAALDKLFLVRMVSSGDQNLKQYVTGLEDAFFGFEEQFGKPATRVSVISLRDNVFQVPFYQDGSSSTQLALADRVSQFRSKLMDESLLDNDGNIVVPFSTDFSQLSPQTNDHKILFLEASIESSDHGDDVGRLYVRQLGSSAVVSAKGDRNYYAFPPRTAVLNPLFPTINSSGREAFDTSLGGPTQSLFRDYRFRDRPYVNSNWQLVFNPRTESVNKDIKLSSIDDIKLYVYYTDFTNL